LPRLIENIHQFDVCDSELDCATSLLHLLADGKVHDRADVGRAIAATRTDVDDALALLRRHGLGVRVRPEGICVPGGIELLAEPRIRSAMAGRDSALSAIDVYLLVDSTNARLLSSTEDPGPRVCLAEAQSAGRGRRGREWVSPLGTNLYLSVLWNLAPGVRPTGVSSLAAGVAVARSIAGLTGLEIGLKWPNDLIWGGRKLGGLLLEHQRIESRSVLVIGVGVNVCMARDSGADIDQPWVTMMEASGGARISRNDLAAAIVCALIETLGEFDHQHSDGWRRHWQRLDIARDRPVRLTLADGTIVSGWARGVDADGALLLESGGGTRAYHSGDVSLRVTK
jgi:BirA family biotin operon repressor/biotin-[acetyl-CoA-carboxylase] ligase